MSDSVTLICVNHPTIEGKMTVFFGDCCALEIFCIFPLVFVVSVQNIQMQQISLKEHSILW